MQHPCALVQVIFISVLLYKDRVIYLEQTMTLAAWLGGGLDFGLIALLIALESERTAALITSRRRPGVLPSVVGSKTALAKSCEPKPKSVKWV